MLLAMAGETGTHGVVYGPLRYRRTGQVAMTGCTGNASPIMRRMLKLHVGRRGKAVYTLPRNLQIFIGVIEDLLHLGLLSCQFRVTEHAFLH